MKRSQHQIKTDNVSNHRATAGDVDYKFRVPPWLGVHCIVMRFGVMESVELRWNNGILEYRALIIRERDVYRDSEPCGDELYVDWSNQYTEWKPVPQADESA